jgi:hypothetical protein
MNRIFRSPLWLVLRRITSLLNLFPSELRLGWRWVDDNQGD